MSVYFFLAVLRNSIKNTQTTCTTYPSSTKAAAPAVATSSFPSSLCTTTTAPYCDYSTSNYYNVPCEPRVNATSTRRDENYYPYNHRHQKQHPNGLYPGNQEHYQQQDYDDDDDDDYDDDNVDDYRLTNNIRGTDSWTQFDNLLLSLKRMML